MYSFYRMLPSGKWKYCETYNSTLDPEYHQYINHCKENDVRWRLVDNYTKQVKFQG